MRFDFLLLEVELGMMCGQMMRQCCEVLKSLGAPFATSAFRKLLLIHLHFQLISNQWLILNSKSARLVIFLSEVLLIVHGLHVAGQTLSGQNDVTYEALDRVFQSWWL